MDEGRSHVQYLWPLQLFAPLLVLVQSGALEAVGTLENL